MPNPIEVLAADKSDVPEWLTQVPDFDQEIAAQFLSSRTVFFMVLILTEIR